MTYRNPNRRQADMTAHPSKYPQGKFKDKPCRQCSTVFSPMAPSHLTCSQKCADRLANTAYLKREYGITMDDYDRMHASQNGLCAICNGPGFTMGKRHKMLLVVDHCHATGHVRGLLCHNCNRALGLMHDSTSDLRAAIAYLEGATTIPQGSRAKQPEAHSPTSVGDDIV